MNALVTRDGIRVEELRRMKARATGLLVVIAVAFVVLSLAAGDGGWVEYALAAAEGSMVGGLADWFAVTALFRHPLGLPIPHTAVISERKDQFGATLGSFVQENFLSPDVVGERVRTARVAARAAGWLAERDHAETVARYVSETLAGFTDLVRDDDVNRLVHEELERAVSAVPLAPLSGRALRFATRDGRHQELLDAALRGVASFLDDNRETLRARFGQTSPWWLPGALEHRIFDRLLDGVRALLDAVNADPDHELRAAFDVRLGELAERLQHDPDLLERGEKLKREVLAQPELRHWTASLWGDLKTALRSQAGDPDSRLRSRLADAVAAAAAQLRDDEALQEKVDSLAEAAVRYLAEHYHDELAGLITGTIARWDAEETSGKLELLLGRDLQFIRINGTVVGGIAGLAIHAVGDVLG